MEKKINVNNDLAAISKDEFRDHLVASGFRDTTLPNRVLSASINAGLHLF